MPSTNAVMIDDIRGSSSTVLRARASAGNWIPACTANTVNDRSTNDATPRRFVNTAPANTAAAPANEATTATAKAH